MSKIIIFTYDYPPSNGGIARLCFEIKKALIADGKDVSVITRDVDGVDLGNDSGVIRIKGRRGILELKMLYSLIRNSSKNDIVITDTFHPAGFLSIFAKRKTYVLAHGAELLEGNTFFKRRIWALYRKLVLTLTNKVIANSHYTSNLVKKCAPKADVVAIPLAVDPVYFKPTASKQNNGYLNLCSISRLEKFKGHDFIINALADLPKEYRDKIRLRIGGNGPYKESLEQLVKDLQLENIIDFTGFIADDKLCDFYSESDAFILCTREEPLCKNVEGFGLVFTEAQACGTPAIGTNTGGIPDAIEDGYGGWLIDQDDTSALKKLLISLLDNKHYLHTESINARKRVEQQCNWGVYYKQLKKIL